MLVPRLTYFIPPSPAELSGIEDQLFSPPGDIRWASSFRQSSPARRALGEFVPSLARAQPARVERESMITTHLAASSCSGTERTAPSIFDLERWSALPIIPAEPSVDNHNGAQAINGGIQRSNFLRARR
jgi:hypothetical protein